MKTAIIIPARFSSSRLPGKPLLQQTGKPLIQYTYEAATKAGANYVIVATDDERIKTAVEGFGGEVMMTSATHETGSSRVAEVAQHLDAQIIINLQGDEPEIKPDSLKKLIEVHKLASTSDQPAFASTLACAFSKGEGDGSPMDPAAVKVVMTAPLSDGTRRALYFSRALVPYPRDANGVAHDADQYYLHVGLYAFSNETIQSFAQMPPSRLERIEQLEQLRILEAGHSIAVGVIDAAPPGIDTPEDYQAFIERQKRL